MRKRKIIIKYYFIKVDFANISITPLKAAFSLRFARKKQKTVAHATITSEFYDENRLVGAQKTRKLGSRRETMPFALGLSW